MKAKFTNDEFIIALKTSESWIEVSRKLGVSHNGSRSAAYKKLCEKLKLTFTNLKGVGWSKGKTLPNRWKINNEELSLIFVENSTYNGGTKGLKNKILRAKLLDYKCIDCNNTGEWNGKKLSLHLDHINGKNNDNRLENLRFLCPNCHSQTETYSGKNNKNKMH